MMKTWIAFDTVLGRVAVACDALGITDVCVGKPWNAGEDQLGETPLLLEAKQQLQEYFAGERRMFSVPLSMHGTPFQMRVWEALKQIPYGETRSYRQIAEAIGKPTACRAVGRANGANSIAIVIPCHRVIGADGSLTGYAGTLPVKQWLLQLEQAHK